MKNTKHRETEIEEVDGPASRSSLGHGSVMLNRTKPDQARSSAFVATALVVVGLFTSYDWEKPAWSSLFGFAGIGVSAVDALCATLVLCCIAVAVSKGSIKRFSTETVLSVILAMFFAISVYRGLQDKAPGKVAAEARVWFQLLSLTILIITFRRELLIRDNARLFKRIAAGIGIGIVAFGMYHWARYGLGSPDLLIQVSSNQIRSSRILNSGQSVFLCCAFFVVLHDWTISHSRLSLVLAIVFGAFVLLAQNRSVWIALVAGIVGFVLICVGPARMNAIAMVAGTVTAFVAVDFFLLNDQLLNQLVDEINNRSTYNDRTSGWSYLVEESIKAGSWTVLTGEGTGSGWLRPGPVGAVDYQPHNWYVLVYLRTGLLGIAVLGLTLIALLAKFLIYRMPTQLAVLLALGVYGWAYGFSWYLGVFTGYLLASALTINELEINSGSTSLYLNDATMKK